ncbi:hypothetical protein FOL46_007744 [Perkinsus olseni]|uniref:Uncharacterized protein n=1 Tax=Perkinsus olseni TaxID=32597 RepID=A0A7J6MP23_PEROL|nr:hypothetical protein FOL46_007744 [Perkinsus olseni]
MVSIVRMRLGMSLERCRLLPRLIWGCTGFPSVGVEMVLLYKASTGLGKQLATVAVIVFCSSSAVTSMTSALFLDHTYYEVLGSPVEKIGTLQGWICGLQAVSLRGLVNNCTGCLVSPWMMPSITGEVQGLLAIMYP